jgi:site-specific DNA recombinase
LPRKFYFCSPLLSGGITIADGLRITGLKDKLLALEARLAEIEQNLSAPAPSPVRLHPNLSELYRRKVEQLAESLRDPAIRPAALDTIRR